VHAAQVPAHRRRRSAGLRATAAGQSDHRCTEDPSGEPERRQWT
jgi:hypothetical protein